MLNNSILYANGPAEEDLKILPHNCLERVLSTVWSVKESFERIIVDGEVTTRYSWKILTDDGDIIEPFKSLSSNPYISQRMARHICDCHNYRLHALHALEAQEAKTIKTDIVKDEMAPESELF
jgi:hypothetical protein